jgi:hypothetical protein
MMTPFSYLSTWSAIVISQFALTAAYNVYYTIGSLRASRMIHAQLIGSVLRSTFRWLGKHNINPYQCLHL